MDSKNFYTDGRWVPSTVGEKSLFPSETQINCSRLSRTCIAATAEYYYGHPHVSIEYFGVLKWDRSSIVALNSDAVCLERTLLISFSDKSVSATGSPKNLPGDTKEACSTMGAGKRYTDFFVVKNSAAWNADPFGESLGK